MTSQFKNVALAALSLIVVAVGFQNCGVNPTFQAGDVKIVDAFCGDTNGCNSASTSPSNTDDGIAPPIQTPAPAPTPNSTPAPAPAPTPSYVMYNFVAGDQATCEASIRNRLGRNDACTVGGGCGISCGMPSSSCPSANPQHYGACINVLQ